MSQSADPEALRLHLWKTIDEARIAMLGANPPNHMQPMTAFAEPESNRIYFYSREDTDLVRDLGAEGEAHMIVISKDHTLRACVRGRMRRTRDRARIDKYWGPVVAAWYPDGKDDPQLTMLEFDFSDADVWISEKGPMKFTAEIAKANITGQEPDLDVRGKVEA